MALILCCASCVVATPYGNLGTLYGNLGKTSQIYHMIKYYIDILMLNFNYSYNQTLDILMYFHVIEMFHKWA